MCGKALSEEAVSTLGEQRQYNYALQPMDRAAFMKLVEVDQPEAPGYFVHDAILNRQERASLDESMKTTLTPLSVDEVVKMRDSGAQIVDTREAGEFAAAHLKGSLNVGIDGKYATWAGTILHKEAPIVIIAEDDRISESVMRLGRIGFDHVAGYLKDGMEALRDHDDLLEHVVRITPKAAAELDNVNVLDVRSQKEWNDGHIEGSLNIPLNQLPNRLAEVPTDKPLVVHCQGGYRSSIAASLLLKNSQQETYDMIGGFKAWEAFHLPTPEAAG